MEISKKYDNNYLKQVIFRIDFSQLLEVNKNGLKPEIQREFAKINFNDFSKRELREFEIIFNKSLRTDKDQLIDIYEFLDKSKNNKITICEKFMIIENFEYVTFEEFKKIISNIVNIFSTHYSINIIRLGLRYINEIVIDEGNPFEWSNFINNSLIFSLNNFLESDKENVCRYIGRFDINKEDYILAIKYGILNSLYPEKIARKEFTLDFDCSTKDVENNDDLFKKLDIFHSDINKYFEKSIDDGLRKKMGELDE